MKILVIVFNILATLALLPALYVAMFSPMMFDSGANQRVWSLFYTVLAIPVSIIVTQIISWVLFSKSAYGSALLVTASPLLLVVLLLVLFFKSGH